MIDFIKFLIENLFGKKEAPKMTLKDAKDYEKENKTAEVKEEVKAPKIPDIKFKNDNPRLIKEYKDLTNKNKPLKELLSEVNTFVYKNFKKDVIITMIFRTQEEQDYLYRNSQKYKKRKFKSPHQFWHAIDIRSFIFTEGEINQIVDFINKKYDSSNYYKFTATCHSVGHGLHFHIQYLKV